MAKRIDYDDDDLEEDDLEDTRRPEGDATGGLIPYKNPAALAAYYCGLFSLFPVLGLFLGLAGFVLGIMGLKHRSRHPETGGAVHAWIGILFGGLFTLIWGLAIIGIVFALITAESRP